MISSQRRKEILEIIRSQGGISVGEIAERYGVSRMTGHRDLQHLERRGVIKRIHGGAVPLGSGAPVPESAPAAAGAADGDTACVVCLRQPATNLRCVLTLTSGERRHACCPHCGISARLVLRHEVASAVTADYLTGRLIPVEEAIFLMGSAAAPCCHPSLLTFADEEQALRFQTGFGGGLGRLDDAVRFLQEAMSSTAAGDTCPNCSPRG